MGDGERRDTDMWRRVVVPNVHSDATVRAEIDDVPLGIIRKGIVLFVCEKQNGMIVVPLKGAPVHDKKFMPCLVDDLVDGQVKCDGGTGRSICVIRHGFIERILVLH